MRKTVLACLCSGFFLLMTCRDIESVTPNREPVAVAGTDAAGIIGPVDLDGSRSSDPDGDRLSYQWSILEHPVGSQASILPFDSVKTIFTPDLTGLYSIRLVVTDNIATSADTINIEVLKQPGAPVADAGKDFALTTGATAQLSGSGFDPDGDSLTYQWTIAQKPVGSTATIKDPTKPKASFAADKDGSYLATLKVSDGTLFDIDSILIIASQKVNHPPVADAGKDGTMNLGDTYALTGSGSDPDGGNLTYTWTLPVKPAGSTAVIQNPSSPTASFVVDRPGSYTATLTVSDGSLTNADQVTITTNNVDVTNINPTSGPYGITIKITGVNFSNVPSENQVVFGKVPAITVSAATYTSLDVVVPKGADTGTVFVTVNGVTDGGPVFTYIPTAVVSTIAQFNVPYAMVSDAQGNLYIADTQTHSIRKMLPNGTLTTIAGTGAAGYLDAKPNQAMFNKPSGIAYDEQNQVLYISDNANHCIRKLDLAAGVVTTFAGFPQAGFKDDTGGLAQFNQPIGLARDISGNLYVGDFGNNRIRKITTAAVVTTLSGNGTAGFADGASKAATFNGIAGVAVDNAGFVYVADGLNNRIRKVATNGAVITLAGNGTAGSANGNGTAATFNIPYGVACNPAGFVYVADFSNNMIRAITPGGDVSTLAGAAVNGSFVDGPGTIARFNFPIGIAMAPNNIIYVADYGNQRVRRIQFE